jgi:hypothetical protein
MEEDIQAVVDWYRKIPEAEIRDIIFRYERIGDQSVADLYQTLMAAKQLSKMWKAKTFR